MAYGLQGVPVDQGGVQVYFGLAGSNLEDDERTIAFFQPERERFLEYDLTKLVYDLSNPKRPVVGVMSSLPVDGDPRAMMMAMAFAMFIPTPLKGCGPDCATSCVPFGGCTRSPLLGTSLCTNMRSTLRRFHPRSSPR